MENRYVVYLLWDPRNGEIRYVGKTGNPKKRFGEHMRGDTRKCHCRSWELSLIEQGLSCEVSIVEEGLTNVEACEYERWWIAYAKQWGWPLTNHTDGGEGMYNPSPETREKIGQAGRGRKPTPQTREKHSQSLIKSWADPEIWGKHSAGQKARCAREKAAGYKRSRSAQSPEAREKIGAANRGRVFSPEVREHMRQAQLGKKLSAETREKISQVGRGRKASPQAREHMSQAQSGHTTSLEARENIGRSSRGRKHSPETREKISVNLKAALARKKQMKEAGWS